MPIERWRIPNSWRWKRLDEIGLVVGGGTPSTRDSTNFDPDGVPWVTPADLSGYMETRISRGRRALSQRGLQTSGATLLPPGSVLFSSRAPIGYCVIAANEIATNQGFKSLILNPAMSAEYVREYLAGSVEYAESRARGTTFKELSGAKFAALRIPVAPPEEQIRIARKLGDANRLVGIAKTEIAAARNARDRLRDLVLRSAFSGELTKAWRAERNLEASDKLVARTPVEQATLSGRAATDRIVEAGVALRLNGRETALPTGWSWQSLSSLGRQETGHTPSRSVESYWDGGIPWVGVKDAGTHHGKVIDDTVQTISESGIQNSSARLLPTGAVLLCRTAASIGYVCKLGRPMATSQDFVAWVCGAALNPSYLMYLLMGERDLLRRLGRGTAHPTIYLPEVKALSIALAPLEEQAEIVTRVELALAKIAEAEGEMATAASLMPKLAKRLHELAFAGLLERPTVDENLVDASLARYTTELAMKKPQRRVSSKKARPDRQQLNEQLAAKYDVWPPSGYSFEDLRDTLTGTYDEIRAAIFTELRASRLAQEFDARRRVMVFVRSQK
jgi:type I restriction enzyme S subunit